MANLASSTCCTDRDNIYLERVGWLERQAPTRPGRRQRCHCHLQHSDPPPPSPLVIVTTHRHGPQFPRFPTFITCSKLHKPYLNTQHNILLDTDNQAEFGGVFTRKKLAIQICLHGNWEQSLLRGRRRGQHSVLAQRWEGVYTGEKVQMQLARHTHINENVSPMN